MVNQNPYQCSEDMALQFSVIQHGQVNETLNCGSSTQHREDLTFRQRYECDTGHSDLEETSSYQIHMCEQSVQL